MQINIRERCQKVSECWQESTNLSRRAIAKILGISKSSVQRHLTSQFRRQQYPESQMWETEAGQYWLRLLVFGAIYYFGIKGGIGAGSLSDFFYLLRLEEQIGCSASAIRAMEMQLKTKIIDYEHNPKNVTEQRPSVFVWEQMKLFLDYQF